MVRSSALLREGTFLSDRYRIIRQIGQGGFGRTYLAEDTSRYREKCVLKEFAPEVETQRDLRKAEELFEREAGILYQLKHNQIPRFEALLRTRVDGKEALFLVQEYIEGDSYWELLKRRGKFSEAEVTELLLELLPVLTYIHSENLIHRDISPDNLIRRTDDKPVLIDFGCVKLAANAVSKSTGQLVTLMGKKGYAPEEQIRNGQAFPCSDLYSLAVTILVLLTGKLPDDLYDSHKGIWNWEKKVKVSSHLSQILTKMLAYNPRDRYQSAEKVQQALEAQDSLFNNFISRVRTLVIAPGDSQSKANGTDIQSKAVSPVNIQISRLKTQAVQLSRRVTKLATKKDSNQLHYPRLALIVTGVIILPGILTFNLVRGWLLRNNAAQFNQLSNLSLSQREQNIQQEIYQRIQALNLDPASFYGQVDRIFYRRYPELEGVPLSDESEHLRHREVWYQIALDLLNQQEQQ